MIKGNSGIEVSDVFPLWLILLSALAGVVRTLRTGKLDTQTLSLNFRCFFQNLTVAVLVGLVAYHICMDFGTSASLAIVVTSVSAVEGVNTLSVFSKVNMALWRQILNIKPDDKSEE
jgi:hypothetical protein